MMKLKLKVPENPFSAWKRRRYHAEHVRDQKCSICGGFFAWNYIGRHVSQCDGKRHFFP